MKMSRRPSPASQALIFLLEPYRPTFTETTESGTTQMVINRTRQQQQQQQQQLVPSVSRRRSDQTSVIEAGTALRQMGDMFDRSKKCENMAPSGETTRDIVTRIINFTASCFPCCVRVENKLRPVKGAIQNEPD